MTKLLLLVAAALAGLTTVAAQTRYCGSAFYTCMGDGSFDEDVNQVTTCTASTVKKQCTGEALNPKCAFSMRLYKQICCYDVKPKPYTTPGPGTTWGSDAVTGVVRNEKPMCPKAALGYGADGTQVLLCNKTNLAKAGCPNSDYSCEKAVNVYDVFGTPADISDDVGAAQTPYLCCQVKSLQSFETVFASLAVGLTPNIVPTSMAPSSGIAALFLPSPAVNVHMRDDISAMPDQLKLLNATITLLSKTKFANATNRYHVLFFDATTNKDCAFFGNVPGTGTAQLMLPAGAEFTNGTLNDLTAVVYTTDKTSALASKKYEYAATYGDPVVFGPANNDKHKFVVLVWATTDALDYGPANTTGATSTTINNKILMGVGPYGDFVPTTDKTNGGTSGGKFTTVTAFLEKSKVLALLKQPIAGTFFWAKK